MAVPHYTYLVLKMPGPQGIITIKGSFEVSYLCDKEFHKMVQNFGMIANYEEPKEKAKIATTEVDKLPEGRPTEPEMKKP
jgi:nitrous oxide reductase accessory protein NosL